MRNTLISSWIWLLMTVIILHCAKAQLRVFTENVQTEMTDSGTEEDAVAAVLSVVWTLPPCSYILFSDGANNGYKDLSKELSDFDRSLGVTVFHSLSDFNSNMTQRLIHLARKVRLGFPCVTVLVLTDDLTYLETFAESSLKNRFLAEYSRLIVVGHLELQEIETLTNHWTISMYNTLIIIPSPGGINGRWDIVSCLPFSADGKKHLVEVAYYWSQSRKLVLQSNLSLFPNKFSNFHGAAADISALPYRPYWDEEKSKDGTSIFSGSDRLLLEAMASTLNFSIHFTPVKNWGEVLQRVSKRMSLVAPTIHVVLPLRLKLVDYCRTYEHGIGTGFALAKPVLQPQWQSLYYPLTTQVWLCILCVLLIAPFCFVKILGGFVSSLQKEKHDTGLIVFEVFGMLFGQPLGRRLPARSSSARILLTSWLIFAFIVGAAYRGNLIAALIAPRYPPRPENLEQLVKFAERVTAPSYGGAFRDMMKNSEYQSSRTLGSLIELGYSATDGFTIALKERAAFLDTVRYLRQEIAEQFTDADGGTQLYVGREPLMLNLNAWPLPHDAPYKTRLDSVITGVIESGLYNKWMKDMLVKATKEGRRKRQDQLKEVQQTKEGSDDAKGSEGSSGNGEPKPLTIVHVQGPLMILTIGMALALGVFTSEVILNYFSYSAYRRRAVRIKPNRISIR